MWSQRKASAGYIGRKFFGQQENRFSVKIFPDRLARRLRANFAIKFAAQSADFTYYMARRLKPTDPGYLALLLGSEPDEAAPDAVLLGFETDGSNPELCAWGEGADVVNISSTAGLLDPAGLGFVAGWSQKKS